MTMARWALPLVLLTSVFVDTYGGQLVATSVGSIQGTSETVDIKAMENEAARTVNLYIYRGIPYGKVTKRFTAPAPADPFTTTFQANAFGNICWNDVDLFSKQWISVTLDPKASNLTQSEDCLYLNVYVPQNTTGASSTAKRTVIVYIHGGYFSYGAGSDFDGRYLAATQDVITVTFNYRLGVLGFLSTGTSASRGNYGLLDQRLALLWVRDNIEHFGGDRESITLLGHGAGATSAAFHTLSPLNKGLFQRAILASGSAISPVPSFNIADNDNGILQFKELVNDLGCIGDDIFYLDLEKMVECIRNLPVSGNTNDISLMSKYSPCSCNLDAWPRYRPVVDGHFLPANPSLLLPKSSDTYANMSTVPFPETDIMFGLNSNEGGRFMTDIKLYAGFTLRASAPDYGINENSIDTFLNLAFPYPRYGKDVDDRIKEAVKNKYFTDGNTPIQNRDAAFDMISDRSFTSGIVANARIHAEVTTTAKTYMYMFDGKSSLIEDYSWNERGASHGDDLPFILGTALVSSENNTYPISGRPITQVQRDVAIAMMKHLGNFAKTGDPSGTSSWEEFTIQSQKYTKISTATNSTTMRTTTETNLRQSNVEFWLNDIVNVAGDGGTFVEASLPPNRAIIYLQPPLYFFENVRGLTEGFHNGKVHVFRGIPYAKTPVRRFVAPTVTRPIDFNDVSAYEFSAACPQTVGPSLTDLTSDPKIHNRTDEDCLYLNIYIPHNTSKTSTKAVMVYIHGGDFKTGSGASIDGRPLALYGDVIIVTFNYRLGLFGFLSTGDEEARGNLAMLDQNVALQWVKQFIGVFGGDSSRVTVFGSDTGGVSAALHALSPLSNGLFQRVISQSGAAIDSGAPWRISTGAQNVLKAFTVINQCDDGGNSTIILNCLRSIAVDTLTTQSNIILSTGYKHLFDYGSLLAPVIDNHFILSHPGDESLKFSEVDYMVGFNSNEGTAEFDMLPRQFEAQQFKHPYPMPEYYYNDMLAGLTLLMPNQKQVIQALKAKYPLEPTDGIATRDNVMKLYGDGLFVAPAYNDALKHYTDMLQTATNTSKRKTYMYEFDLSPSLLVTTPWSIGYGAGHGDELPYVFGMPLYSKDVLSKRGKIVRDIDEKMSRTMMAYWTNFAKTGDPSVGDLPIHTAWSPFTEKDREVLVIGSSETNSTTDVHVEVKKNIRWNDAYYWNQYVPYVKEQYCTEPTTTTEGTTVQVTTSSLKTTTVVPTTVPEVASTTTDAFSTLRPTLPITSYPTSTNSEPMSTAAPDRPTSTPIPQPGPTTQPSKSTQSTPVTNSPTVCPPIADQQLGNMAIDVKTGESMIIGLAAALCVLFITSIVFIILYCKKRNELNNVPKGHPIYDNPTFTQF